MNRILKNIYVLITTLVLLLGAAFIATKEEEAPPHFQVQNEFGQQNISIFDRKDGNFYVFLPSYARLDQVRMILPQKQIFFLDDIRLWDQMSCAGFELDRPYCFSINGENVGTLWFYQSRNVAAMYLDTATGEMTQIHQDKNHEEYATMVLYAQDGSIAHMDASSRLKGRGNSTWDQDKRPYLLTLSSDANLLEMGSGKKWVLLANSYDETNLNNKLIFDLAAQVGFRWSPDCQFVDLYLNGEYSGLYLLTEKIELHPNRVDLDTASGEFLCKVDTWERRELLQYYLETAMGRVIEICAENAPSAEELDHITYMVYLLEEELRSGGDLRNSEIMDLDSWIRRYLIDEISGNIDSDLTSSYFYFSDGMFFAGPVWDYDMAFGDSYRNQEAHSFIAKNAYKRSSRPSPYYSALYANESFQQRMVEIYREEFLPVLQDMIDGELENQICEIREASRMNSIRWRAMFDDWRNVTVGLELVQEPEQLQSYFERRIRFLNSAWLDNVEYCTVQFETEPEGAYWNISVEKGKYLETTYMNLGPDRWFDKETGQAVDFQSPITRDITVTLVQEQTVSEEIPPEEEEPAEEPELFQEEPAETLDKKELLLVAAFLFVFAALLLMDGCRRRKENKK